MPWFLPALAAGTTIVLAKKLVARAWNEYFVQYATVDPPGYRTVALVGPASAEPGLAIEDVLLAIAAELSRDLAGTLAVARDAIRIERAGAGHVEIVRATQLSPVWRLELTRAWTGVHLDDTAKRALRRIDDALRSHAPRLAIAWFARQDRRFVTPFDTPCDAAGR